MKRAATTTAMLFACMGLQAATIFDNASSQTVSGSSLRDAGNAPLTHILSVTSNVTIDSISVYNHLNSSGSLKFLIFDDTARTLLWSSAAVDFAADAAGQFTWKSSGPISFVLLAGNSYDVGAIGGAPGLWPYFFELNSYTQNGITSDRGNANVASYAAPYIEDHGSADIPLILGGVTGGQQVPAVPEPGSLGLLAFGIAAVVSRSLLRPTR